MEPIIVKNQCLHGQLARSCNICELEKENEKLKVENLKFRLQNLSYKENHKLDQREIQNLRDIIKDTEKLTKEKSV